MKLCELSRETLWASAYAAAYVYMYNFFRGPTIIGTQYAKDAADQALMQYDTLYKSEEKDEPNNQGS